GGAFEGARRGTFEVHPGKAKAAAVARAFEFLLAGQVVRRAPEMRAHGNQRIETAVLLNEVLSRSHQPDAEFVFPALVDPDAVLGRKASLEMLRRFIEDIRE